MSNLNLYNIEREYIELAEQLIEAGGEVTEELEEALAINRDDLDFKVAKYGYVTLSMDNDIDAIDGEISRLTDLKNKRIKAKESLKERVKSAMQLYGIKKIESQNLKILLVPSKAVIIEDESLLPKKYKPKKTVITYPIDKRAIKSDIDAGKKIKGAFIQENQNLQIK